MRLAALILLFCYSAFAEDIWITQLASGGDTGADAANAHSLAWLNSAANWGAGADKASAGDTVHLSGTFIGGNNATILDVAGAGESNNPVTIRFESGAKMQAPYFAGQGDFSGAIECRQNYITIDGGTDGTIEATNNGTALASQEYSTGVYIDSTVGVTVKNLTVTNMYVNGGSSPSATDTGGAYSYGISAAYANSYLRICSNRVYGARAAITVGMENQNGSNIEIDHNTTSDHCWGISFGVSDTANTVSGVTIHDNTVTGWSNWQYPVATYHTDGIIGFSAFGGVLFQPRIYNNLVYGYLGGGSPTALIAFDSVDVGPDNYITNGSMSALIYNNLLVTTNGGTWAIMVGFGTNCLVANNTIVATNGNTAIEISAVGSTVKNNLIVCHSHVIGTDYTVLTNAVTSSDNNLWSGISSSLFYGTEASYTLAQWRALGRDVSSLTNTPLLNADFTLSASSPARNAGADMSAWGFSTDRNGKLRFGKWDIGAYEFVNNAVYFQGKATMQGRITF